MTYVPPTPYVRQSRFAQFGNNIPGTTADVELDDVKIATDSLLAALNVLQRGDGKLNNGLVSPDSLSAATLQLIAGWNPRGVWLTGANYAAKDMVEQPASSGTLYVCVAGHTAGTFATDLAAGKWTVISGISIGTGATGQIAFYASNGAALTATSALPNGITATTQAPTDASTLIATMAALAVASGKVKIQVFDIGGGSTQTYTPSAGMVNALGFTWGGGGGGGGTAAAGGTGNSQGGGGGAGSLSIKLMTAAQIGASKTITLGAAGTAGAAGNNAGGAGGDTSIGVLCIAKGGSGGAGSAGGAGFAVAAGGAGGVAGTGDIAPPGMSGAAGTISTAGSGASLSGSGGSSLLGSGGMVQANVTGTVAPGTGRASGGAGGYSVAAGTAAGGAGTAGHCFIIEFCNQG